jgi:uncharacterized protein
MPTVHTMMRPPMSLMAQLDAATLRTLTGASSIAADYAVDQDPLSAKEMLAAQLASAEAAATQARSTEVADERPRRGTRSNQPPETGVDWGDVAKEGARIARSGAFNTILRGVLGVLNGGSRRR